jgi:hypothetical protein
MAVFGHHLHDVVADLLDHAGVLIVQFAEHLDAFGRVFLLGVLDVLLVGVKSFGLGLQDGQPVEHQVADRVGLGHGGHGCVLPGWISSGNS